MTENDIETGRGHGNIKEIKRLNVSWGTLPFSLVASAILGVVLVGVGKGAVYSTKRVIKKSSKSKSEKFA